MTQTLWSVVPWGWEGTILQASYPWSLGVICPEIGERPEDIDPGGPVSFTSGQSASGTNSVRCDPGKTLALGVAGSR